MMFRTVEGSFRQCPKLCDQFAMRLQQTVVLVINGVAEFVGDAGSVSPRDL